MWVYVQVQALGFQINYTLLPPVIKTRDGNYNWGGERQNQFNLREHYEGISWVERELYTVGESEREAVSRWRSQSSVCVSRSFSAKNKLLIEGLAPVLGARGGPDEKRDAGLESTKTREREGSHVHTYDSPSLPLLYNSSSMSLSHSLSLSLCQRGQNELRAALIFPENTSTATIYSQYCWRTIEVKEHTGSDTRMHTYVVCFWGACQSKLRQTSGACM